MFAPKYTPNNQNNNFAKKCTISTIMYSRVDQKKKVTSFHSSILKVVPTNGYLENIIKKA